MTKDRMLATVAATLMVLAETDGAPESVLYMTCDMVMNDYQALRGVLTRGNLVTITGNYVRLTAAGRAMATAVNATVTMGGVIGGA